MGNKHQVTLVLITTLIMHLKAEDLLPATTTPSTTNNCSYSLKKQILTCENVVWKQSNIENMINNCTTVLVLKDSDKLVISPAIHTKPFENLKTYQLVGNKNLEIRPFSFQKLVNLKYIKIIDNIYTTVANNTFYGLSELEVLNLNNNSISDVEPNAFHRLVNLEILELTHNTFKIVPSLVFDSLKNLKSLFLYHNNIEILEPDCLSGLTNLNVLDLTYNRITAINTNMFNDLQQLTHLYLSFNQIESIDGDFTSPKLEFLYLQNNKLKVISNTIFANLINLVDVDISKNKIENLHPDAFYNNTKLTNLNYKENNLNSPVQLNFQSSKPFITA